jgi:hypothetical protein
MPKLIWGKENKLIWREHFLALAPQQKLIWQERRIGAPKKIFWQEYILQL